MGTVNIIIIVVVTFVASEFSGSVVSVMRVFVLPNSIAVVPRVFIHPVLDRLLYELALSSYHFLEMAPREGPM